MRVYELAKKLNMETKALLDELQGLGMKVTTGINSIDPETVQEVIALLSETKKPAPKPAPLPVPELPEKTEKPKVSPKKPEVSSKEAIDVPYSARIRQLAQIVKDKPSDLIKALMKKGVMATINQQVTREIVAVASDIYQLDLHLLSSPVSRLSDESEEDIPESLLPRPPVVTIMGHVDHGKTKLLDAIRKSNVVDTEAGGITQHIGAYKVKVGNGEVVFLDTPGHEAFTAMRARGAQATDVVVLVVAADDGVMPQTVEAIDHIRAAEVPVIVAINKIDLPNANPNQIKQQLSEYDFIPEEWGGKTIFAEISAKQRIGLEHLLEMLLLEAEMIELKANPNRKAEGVIIETQLNKGRGAVATVLVQKGTLKIGDAFVAGTVYGRVRAMYNDHGERIESAPPSTPVEVLGFAKLAQAGDLFKVVSTEKVAKQIILRLEQEKPEQKQRERVSLEDLYQQIQSGKVKELNVIIKADVSGSIEAAIDVLLRIGSDKVKVKFIHSGVGEVNESDIMLASASNGIVISFHLEVRPEIKALAQNHKVDIRTYTVIYEMTKEVKKALEGLLEPKFKEVFLGTALIKEVFKASKIGLVAGSYIKQGKAVRGAMARLIRNSEVILEAKITSLKRFKEDVSEVQTNYECGIGLEGATDIQTDDIVEIYTLEKTLPQL